MSNNSTNVIPFKFDKQEVRTLLIDDQPWFAAQDVLDSLEYADSYKPSRAMSHVPEVWKGVQPLHTLRGTQQVLMISEQGLYFVLGRSDKPKALPFQMWLAGEVLPSIRKNGSYVDHEHNLGDLVGAVIGSSGEVVLDRVIDQKGYLVPSAMQRSFRHTMKSRLRTRFNVQRTALIPAECLADACNFVAAYVVEGEFLPRQGENQISLPHSDPEARWLVSLDQKGKPQIVEVPKDAYVLSQREYLTGIAKDGDIPLSTEEMIGFTVSLLQKVQVRYRYGQARRKSA